MRRFLAGGVILMVAAFTAAGAVSADMSSFWSKRSRPKTETRPAQVENGYGQPDLAGTVLEVEGKVLSVRDRSNTDTYRVDISDADFINAASYSFHRGDNVLVWGNRDSRRINAKRVQRLGDNQRDERYNRNDRNERNDQYNRNNRDERNDQYNRNNRDDRYNRGNGNDRYGSYGLTGEVTRRSEKMSSRDIRVRDRYRDWTVEVPKGTRILRGGEDISVHEIREGDTVRIQGERDGDSHFRADRIVVESRYSDSSSQRHGDRTTLSGSVRDIDYRAGTFRLRINFFETYTVRLTRDTRILRDRHEVSLRALREDSRVQVQGDRDQGSHQIDAYRVEIQ